MNAKAQEEARRKLQRALGGAMVTDSGDEWAAQNAPELRKQIRATLARIEPPDLLLLWLLAFDLAAQPD